MISLPFVCVCVFHCFLRNQWKKVLHHNNYPIRVSVRWWQCPTPVMKPIYRLAKHYKLSILATWKFTSFGGCFVAYNSLLKVHICFVYDCKLHYNFEISHNFHLIELLIIVVVCIFFLLVSLILSWFCLYNHVCGFFISHSLMMSSILAHSNKE